MQIYRLANPNSGRPNNFNTHSTSNQSPSRQSEMWLICFTTIFKDILSKVIQPSVGIRSLYLCNVSNRTLIASRCLNVSFFYFTQVHIFIMLLLINMCGDILCRKWPLRFKAWIISYVHTFDEVNVNLKVLTQVNTYDTSDTAGRDIYLKHGHWTAIGSADVWR
jgi:hypothetical protein